MTQLAIRLQRHPQVDDRPIDTGMGAVATLRRLTDETGARPGATESTRVVVPANNGGVAPNVTVSPGRWLIEATLPSGELITGQVDVGSGNDLVAVTLHVDDHSPQAWLAVDRDSPGEIKPLGARADAGGARITQARSAKGGPDAMAEHESSATPTTFTAPDLAPEATAKLDLAGFVTRILAELSKLKDEREAYYELRRHQNSGWANGSRRWLAITGAVALLLTGVAAALRFAPDSWGVAGWDREAFIAVLAMYALMGAISFYENGTDRTSTYFRHLLIILAIRDLWTKLQFEVLKELSALQAAPGANAETATRQRIHALAEAFCNDLNKATTTELSEWRTEFVTSLSELAQAAQKGTEDVTKQIQEVVNAAGKAAADAKASAEKAEAAAKAAEMASQPGYLNVTLGWEFDGEAVVLVDGVEAARSTGKILTIGPIAPGFKKLVAQAQKGSQKLEASKTVKVESGLRDIPFPG
jgi:hypothetical protein